VTIAQTRGDFSERFLFPLEVLAHALQLSAAARVLKTSTESPNMKTTLISLFAATLIGFASIATGRSFDAADFIAISFAVGLAAWTIEQYSRQPRPLTYARPIRLPISPAVQSARAQAQKMAA
jgi:uncharacterized membrane protein YoaK (UPF0700 family)